MQRNPSDIARHDQNIALLDERTFKVLEILRGKRQEGFDEIQLTDFTLVYLSEMFDRYRQSNLVEPDLLLIAAVAGLARALVLLSRSDGVR